MLNPKITITGTWPYCPIVVNDLTDYTEVAGVGKFQINDPRSVPTASSTTIFSSVTLGLIELLSAPVVIEVDACANIEYLERKNEEFLAQFQQNGIGYRFEIIAPDNDPKSWYIEIKAVDFDLQGVVLDAFTDGFNLAPITEDVPITTKHLISRNISIYDPSGNQVDLGQVAQEEKTVFLMSSYATGTQFVYGSCQGDPLTYNVVAGREDRSCVIADLIDLYNSNYEFTVASALDDDSIKYTATEAGTPFSSVYLGYELQPNSNYIVTTQITPNVSSIGLPYGDMSVSYTPSEEGGGYTAEITLYVTDPSGNCSYICTQYHFENWCYDISNIECAIVDLISSDACKNCGKNTKEIALLRNVLEAASIMDKRGYKQDEIGCIIKSVRSLIKPYSCGCSTCG